jgi:hypothetical protein
VSRRRKGRPLLLAAAGVAFVSFACEPKPDVITGPSPVGNLRAPDPIPFEDSGAPITGPEDAGAPDVVDIITAPSPPVGNLRAPDYVPPKTKADAGSKKPPH